MSEMASLGNSGSWRKAVSSTAQLSRLGGPSDNPACTSAKPTSSRRLRFVHVCRKKKYQSADLSRGFHASVYEHGRIDGRTGQLDTGVRESLWEDKRTEDVPQRKASR